jgi:hypothetical protein
MSEVKAGRPRAEGEPTKKTSRRERLEALLHPDRSNPVLWLTRNELWVAIGACIAFPFLSALALYIQHRYIHQQVPTLERWYRQLPDKSTLKALGVPSSVHDITGFRKWMLSRLHLPTDYTYEQFKHYLEAHAGISWVPAIALPLAILALMAFGTWYRRRAPLIVPLALAGIYLFGSAGPIMALPFFGLGAYLLYKSLSRQTSQATSPSANGAASAAKGALRAKGDVRAGKLAGREGVSDRSARASSLNSPLSQVRARRASGRYTPPKKK